MSGKSKELVRLFSAKRGKAGEEFRVSLDEFEPDDGEPAKYVSLRVWFRGREKMLPGKVGCTVRRGELRKVIEALEHAERILNSKQQSAPPVDLAVEDAAGLF